MRRKKKQKPLRHRGFAHKSGCFYRQTKGRRAPWVFLLLPHMVSSRNLINVARKKFAGKKRGRDESLVKQLWSLPLTSKHICDNGFLIFLEKGTDKMVQHAAHQP